ncbi:MAG: hypothetical protein OXI79_10330 [Gammaproteobacteria bacterium]|nr:hypothetical protein [Gammaproteobacteria bacterium]
MAKRGLNRRVDVGNWLGRGFGKGFVAGGVLGVSIGIAAFALVPALVLAMLSLGVGLWFYRKIAFEAKTIRDVGQ